MRLHTLHYIAIHAKHCPSVCCGWRCFWIRFHRLSVADKLLFSKPDKSDIKVGPAVREEEEPQKKEDKGIWELSLMLDQPHQQSCSCGGFALDVMSTPIKWINLLRWGRCKFWGWVGLGPVLSALYAFCPGVCCLCCCVELDSVRLGTKATLSAHILGLRYVSQFEQIFCATLIIKWVCFSLIGLISLHVMAVWIARQPNRLRGCRIFWTPYLCVCVCVLGQLGLWPASVPLCGRRASRWEAEAAFTVPLQSGTAVPLRRLLVQQKVFPFASLSCIRKGHFYG